jgi:hypothetical protein
MKSIIIISAFISFFFFTCKQQEGKEEPKPDTPKALQEKNSSGYLTKSRGEEDLVESLYSELVEKTPALKELEETIEKLDIQKQDSLKSFEKFNQKNTSYYSSAKQHLGQISDSLLRLKIKSIIDNSLNNYNSKIARHKSLVSILSSKDSNLTDLHIVLKLVKTIPLMEKYQVENTPSSKPIEEVIKDFDRAIQKANTLAK